MDHVIKAPSKEEVREYMQRRVADHSPPPSMKQIRRELGWELVAAPEGGKDEMHTLVWTVPSER